MWGLEKIQEFLLLCTRMSHKTLDKIAFVVDHLPYSGIPQSKQDKLEAIEVEALPPAEIKIEFFDFNQLRDEPDKFPHLRIIGKTGVGKTRFTEWIMDMLGGYQYVITPKKKPSDWSNHKVYGYPFNWKECEDKLVETQELMYERYKLMEEGKTPHQINFVCDEWKLISKSIPSAKEIMKDIIVVARDAKIRMLALAQGENVATWGLEGESDLEECFTTVRFGEFALDHCKYLRNKYRKDSEEYNYYSTVLKELESQGFRCCMIEHQPAKVPNLSNWKPGFREPIDSFNPKNAMVAVEFQNGNSLSLQKQTETSIEQALHPLNQKLEGEDLALWNQVRSYLNAGKSPDWITKNLPALPRNYQSARKIVDALIQQHNQEN
jgi:hypothetical protein